MYSIQYTPGTTVAPLITYNDSVTSYLKQQASLVILTENYLANSLLLKVVPGNMYIKYIFLYCTVQSTVMHNIHYSLLSRLLGKVFIQSCIRWTGERPTSIAAKGISLSVEKHLSTRYDNYIVNASAAAYDTGDEGDCSAVKFGESISSLFSRYSYQI